MRPLPITRDQWQTYELLDEERVVLGQHILDEMERLGMSQAQYAAHIGMSRRYLQQYIEFLRAVPELAAAVRSQRLSFTLARAIARLAKDDPERQREAVRWALDPEHAGRLTEQKVEDYMRGEKVASYSASLRSQ